MRKVLFLMFLLLLMGLGAASVKAQVRIGGNTPPNPAAALDLNANDDATPTGNKGGLALPRVSLTSNTAQLKGATPITGMLVYNTNASMTNGNGVGMYYWDGSSWVMPIRAPSGMGRLFLWASVLDTTIQIPPSSQGTYLNISSPRSTYGDLCYEYGTGGVHWTALDRILQYTILHPGFSINVSARVVCYRPIPLM